MGRRSRGCDRGSPPRDPARACRSIGSPRTRIAGRRSSRRPRIRGSSGPGAGGRRGNRPPARRQPRRQWRERPLRSNDVSLNPPPTGAGSPAPRLEAGAEKSAHRAPVESREVTRGKADGEEGAVAPAVRPAPLDDAALSTDEPEPAPAEGAGAHRSAGAIRKEGRWASRRARERSARPRGPGNRAGSGVAKDPLPLGGPLRLEFRPRSAREPDRLLAGRDLLGSRHAYGGARSSRAARARLTRSPVDDRLRPRSSRARAPLAGDRRPMGVARAARRLPAFFEPGAGAYETGVSIDAEAGAPDSARAPGPAWAPARHPRPPEFGNKVRARR